MASPRSRADGDVCQPRIGPILVGVGCDERACERWPTERFQWWAGARRPAARVPRILSYPTTFAKLRPLCENQHHERGQEGQGRIDRRRPRRDGENDVRGHDESGPEPYVRRKQPPREMIRRQRSADRQDGRRQTGSKLVDAEEFETAHHQPEHQRWLFRKERSVESRHDPIAAHRHFAGDRRIQCLVVVPQGGRSKIGQEHRGCGEDDDELLDESRGRETPRGRPAHRSFSRHLVDKRYGQDRV